MMPVRAPLLLSTTMLAELCYVSPMFAYVCLCLPYVLATYRQAWSFFSVGEAQGGREQLLAARMAILRSNLEGGPACGIDAGLRTRLEQKAQAILTTS